MGAAFWGGLPGPMMTAQKERMGSSLGEIWTFRRNSLYNDRSENSVLTIIVNESQEVLLIDMEGMLDELQMEGERRTPNAQMKPCSMSAWPEVKCYNTLQHADCTTDSWIHSKCNARNNGDCQYQLALSDVNISMCLLREEYQTESYCLITSSHVVTPRPKQTETEMSN